ncbi:MAG TPA: amino acid permease [Terriglobia bacterium]|nr:amino acid permease [Terriglobia bacterium]
MTNRRVLTLTVATVTVVANMVGTGVFTTTGLMAQNGAGGGDILMAWILGGLIALCGALCYGEVGANLPHSGGEYYYLSRLIHPSLGFVSGTVSVVVGFAAPIAASAIAMNIYLSTVVLGWPIRSMSVVVVIALAMLHARDVHIGSRFQTLITVTKVLLIVSFIGAVLFAFPKGDHGDLFQLHTSFLTSSSFAIVLVFVAFAYTGWNAATYIATELKDPKRTLPRSLLLGTLIVILLYVLLNLAYLLVVPAKNLSGVDQVGYVVASALWGSKMGGIVSMLIALTLLCPISSMLMVGPRIAEAMARDGFLPMWLSKLNHRHVPARAIALQAGIAALIAITFTFEHLLLYIGFTLNIFAALTVLSLFKLRREGRSKVKICIGYPITPLIFLGFTIWMTVWSINEVPEAALAGLLTLASGFVLYLFRAKQARLAVDVVD